MNVLDQAVAVHPNSLRESMRMEWSVDINNGSLQKQYEAYIHFKGGERNSQLSQDLHTLHQAVADNLNSVGKCKCPNYHVHYCCTIAVFIFVPLAMP